MVEGGESVQWTLYFKEGGVGTIIPLFFRCVQPGWQGRCCIDV